MIRQYFSLNKIFKHWGDIKDMFKYYKIDGVFNIVNNFVNDKYEMSYITFPYCDITNIVQSAIDDNDFKKVIHKKRRKLLY